MNIKFNLYSLLFYWIPMAFSALISIISFYEFYNVAIYKKGNSSYPFGCINECKWYYLNEKNYANFNLCFGVLYAISFCLFILGFYKKKDFILFFSTILFVIFFVAERITMKISG